MSADIVKTSVVQFADNCLLVHFNGKAPDEKAHLLQRTLADWLKDRPSRSVARTKSIKTGHKLAGLLVWLEPLEAPVKRDLKVAIANSLLDCFPKEHLEAMIDRAFEVFSQHPVGVPLAAVNRQGVTVVMVPQKNMMHVLPLDEVRGLNDDARSRVQAWMAKPKTNLYVLELPQFPVE